jgi:hypothetical protein
MTAQSPRTVRCFVVGQDLECSCRDDNVPIGARAKR